MMLRDLDQSRKRWSLLPVATLLILNSRAYFTLISVTQYFTGQRRLSCPGTGRLTLLRHAQNWVLADAVCRG